MSDIAKETVIPFCDLPEIYKARGRTVSAPSIYRWALKGISGVRLERTIVNGQLCTSHEALDRFDKEVAAVRLGIRLLRLQQQVDRSTRCARTPKS